MSEQSESYMNGWRAGYHNATLAERERIIKLLQEHAPQPNDHDFVGCESDECPVNQWFHIHLIELIKGQQND